MPVGLVGGATKVHPVAQAARRAARRRRPPQELADVIVAVGLAQNRPRSARSPTEGIQRGHMSLHARNVAVSAGASGEEVDAVVQALVAEGKVRQDRAEAVLAELRAGVPV